MFESPQDLLDLVLAASVFGLVLSVWIGGIVLWSGRRSSRQKKVHERLGLREKPTEERVLHLWREGREYTTTVPVIGNRIGWLRKFDDQCRRIGWDLGGDRVLLLVGGVLAATAAFVAVVSGGRVLLGVGVAVALLVVFRIVMAAKTNKFDRLFERQLVDSLELAARSLRAGHPLLGAFQLLSQEMAHPVRDVFVEICQRHEMGGSLEDVLRDVGDSSASPDMKLFSTSVAIQMRSGGNLADLMDRLAAVIRDRIRLSRRVRVLTAQTQMSKRVLLSLPFLVFIALNIIEPDYMSLFYKTFAGQMMLIASATAMLVGAWIMNRIARLTY
ncbi:MAG: type II secretion system F family protein [Planctomycetota bacterium]